MKRIVFTIILFLLLVSGGATVNVAVAWGCAWYWGGSNEGLYSRPEGGRRLHEGGSVLAHAYSRPGASQVYVWLAGFTGREDQIGSDPIDVMTRSGPITHPWSRLVELESRFQSKYVTESWTEWATGWPCLACGGYHSRRIRVFKDGGMYIALESSGVFSADDLPRRNLGHTDPRRIVVPYHPIYRGFIVNTLFYAVILWLVIPGPFLLRRLIRIKRGRCVRCGYDLRGGVIPGCPECGWERDVAAARARASV